MSRNIVVHSRRTSNYRVVVTFQKSSLKYLEISVKAGNFSKCYSINNFIFATVLQNTPSGRCPKKLLEKVDTTSSVIFINKQNLTWVILLKLLDELHQHDKLRVKSSVLIRAWQILDTVRMLPSKLLNLMVMSYIFHRPNFSILVKVLCQNSDLTL